MNELWQTLAARAGLTLSSSQHALLVRFLDLLFEANQRMNLTRIIDRSAAEVQHVGDALTLLPFLPGGKIQLADVGSGGGVPGFPLAIARPDARVVLIESTQKKANFLRETASKLSLANVVVRAQRAEDAGRSDLRESCNAVVARAVGELAMLVEWCLPLVKKGGKLLAMKGARAAEELPAAASAITALSGGAALTHAADLPGAEHHVILEIPKIGKTPPMYPRDPTVAKGKPIG